MDFSLIGSKSLKKNTTLDISEFASQGANFFYLDRIETQNAREQRTIVATQGKGSFVWRVGRENGLVIEGNEKYIISDNMTVVYGINHNILTGFVAGTAHGVFNDDLGGLISLGSDATKYSVRRFEYYIRGARYVSSVQTDLLANFAPGNQFKVIMANANGIYTLPANQFPSPDDLNNGIEIGAIRTTNGSTIDTFGTSAFYVNDIIKNIYIWSKYAKKTNYLTNAGIVTENVVPLKLDIQEGKILTPNMSLQILQGQTTITVSPVYNVSGNYTIQTPIVSYSINVTQYDNGTDLVALGSNKYAIHTLFRSSRTNAYYLVIGRGEYNTIAEAKLENINNALFTEGSEIEPIARIIVIKDGISISEIVDVRNI